MSIVRSDIGVHLRTERQKIKMFPSLGIFQATGKELFLLSIAVRKVCLQNGMIITRDDDFNRYVHHLLKQIFLRRHDSNYLKLNGV